MMISDLWWSATPCRSMVWALPLSLAATQGIDVSFSSSGYLDVSVHRVTSCIAMYSLYGTYTLLYVGSPIRRSADQRLFAPPRSLSQLVTSFFGSCCQGIRLMLLLAWSKSMLVFCPHCCVAAQSIRCSHTQVCSASFSFARLALRTKSCALYILDFKSLSW